MRRLAVTRFPIDERALKQRNAEPQDYDRVITEPTELVLGGEVVCGYYPLEEDWSGLLNAVQTIQYDKDYRTDGMRSRSRIFGYRPREPLRKDFCAVTRLRSEAKPQHDLLCSWAEIVQKYYERANPKMLEGHKKVVEPILPEWRMNDTVFTSGIVNYDFSLRYHRDQGNFAGTWNGMIVLQHDSMGGDTVVPAFRVAFSFPRPAVMIFPAESVLHGVTPFRLKSKHGYRYSVVYYSLKAMCHCGTQKEELARVRKLSTERATRRLDFDKTLERIEGAADRKMKAKLVQLRESGKIDQFRKKNLTPEERIARLRRSKSARAKVVLARLEKKLAAEACDGGE